MRHLRDRNVYVTSVKAKLYNMNYPKWRPHTVDIVETKFFLLMIVFFFFFCGSKIKKCFTNFLKKVIMF